MPHSSTKHYKGLDLRNPLVFDTRDLGPGVARTLTRSVPAPEHMGVAMATVPAGAELELEVQLEGVSEGVLVTATVTGGWYLKQIYAYAYFPLYLTVLALGAMGILPRVRPSTKGEGTERRYFYGSVWAVTLAQALLMLLWKLLPRTHAADWIKLAAYLTALALLGLAARAGLLPRTRPIVAGELMVAD
jgi:hypothetical protein